MFTEHFDRNMKISDANCRLFSFMIHCKYSDVEADHFQCQAFVNINVEYIPNMLRLITNNHHQYKTHFKLLCLYTWCNQVSEALLVLLDSIKPQPRLSLHNQRTESHRAHLKAYLLHYMYSSVLCLKYKSRGSYLTHFPDILQ